MGAVSTIRKADGQVCGIAIASVHSSSQLVEAACSLEKEVLDGFLNELCDTNEDVVVLNLHCFEFPWSFTHYSQARHIMGTLTAKLDKMKRETSATPMNEPASREDEDAYAEEDFDE